MKNLSEGNVKLKHTKNIYFCFKEVGTTLDYSILVNVEEKDKSSIYKKEEDGFNVVKVLCNE